MEMATSLALSEGAELHFVHAWMIFGKNTMQSLRHADIKDEINAWITDQAHDIRNRADNFKKKIELVLGEKGYEYLQPEIHKCHH